MIRFSTIAARKTTPPARYGPRTGPLGQKTTIAVNLKKIKRGKADDIVLQKDDVVLVPESYF